MSFTETLRVIVDHLIERRGDYRDLFTTRSSFMTRRLGAVYRVPVAAEQGWETFEFAEGDPRGGLLAHASLNMLNAHPGRSSATLRGVFLRESLLCQEVPPAPADVDFGLFNEDDTPKYRTARERLSVHSTAASCRNCHKLSDPIGLGLGIKLSLLASYTNLALPRGGLAPGAAYLRVRHGVPVASYLSFAVASLLITAVLVGCAGLLSGVIVAGSLYTVGEVHGTLGPAADRAADAHVRYEAAVDVDGIDDDPDLEAPTFG